MKRLVSLLWVLIAAAAGLNLPAIAQTSPFLSDCPVFPADNVWNTPVDDLPVDSSSSAYIESIGANTGVHPDFGSGLWDGAPIGIPFNIVSADQPRVQIAFDYWDESDPGPYPIPPDAAIEGGIESEGDRHVLVLDRDSCILYETWSTYPQPDGTWAAGSGAIFDLNSNLLRPRGWTSSDAAGLPVLPGLVRYEEVAAGEINHALRFTAPRTRKEYVWPARHYASSLTSMAYPPMGQRFRLKADFDISAYSAEVKVILRALQKYGMILADNGSAWYISGVPDPRWDNDSLVGELRTVSGADFEAIDESSLMISLDSGQALRRTTDLQPPSMPTGLAATAVSSGTINIAWNASTDNVGVDGYLVFRDGVHIGTPANPAFQDHGLTPATGYSYSVSAFDAAGNESARTAAIAATTLPATSTAFRIGDRIQTTERIGIRSAPSESGVLTGMQTRGVSGTVVDGPLFWNGAWWWRIDFTRGYDGWTSEVGLKKVSRPGKTHILKRRTR